ncbi:MAG TPA: hypothetical protein VFC79_11390 [Tissierellaceae bacterium]|nr:hypothetical protein [Tissierellaceae bacterium]
MQYRLFVYSKRTKEYEPKGNYKTKQMAETKAEPHIKKDRKTKIIAIPTDELTIGMKVYASDGELYGEIIDESNSFWYIRREGKGSDDSAFFLKDKFIDKFVVGTFITKEVLDG